MYKSYSMNNMPQQVNHKDAVSMPIPDSSPSLAEKKEAPKNASFLKSDDLILILVIFMLLFNDCDDKLLLIALAYVFFADYFG